MKKLLAQIKKFLAAIVAEIDACSPSAAEFASLGSAEEAQ